MLSRVHPMESLSQLYDDFFTYDTAKWPTDTNDGATGAVGALQTAGSGCGVLSLATAAAIDDYHMISGVKAIEFLANRPVICEIRFKITESSANSSHWCFGITDTLTGGWLTNGTGAPLGSYHGAMFWKPAGASTIKFETANAATKNANANVGTFVSGSFLTLGFAFDPGNGTTGWVQPLINGVGVDATLRPIPRSPVALAGLAPAALAFCVKASTAAAETMLVDYCGVDMYR